MREPIRACSPRRSSLSPTRDRDGKELSMIKPGDVSSHSDQIDVVSHGVEQREHDVDGIRRDSDMYDVEMQRSVVRFDKDRREEEERDNERYMKNFQFQEDFGKQYSKRSDSNETVRHGIGSSIPSLDEMYRKHDVEPSRLGDESKPSRLITPREYEYSPFNERNELLLNDETKRVERISRHSEDRRDSYVQESSPLSQVGSSMADLEDERSRLNLDSRCCSLVNDSDRVDERKREDYNENLCVSHVSRHLDYYVVRNSARDQQEKSSRDPNYSCGLNCGDHDSPTASRCGKEIVDESRQNYHVGSDVAKFPSVRLDVNNVARESDLLMQTGRSLSKSHARGSSIAGVDAEDSHHDLCMKERMRNDLSDHVKQRDDNHHYRSIRNESRKVVYVDNKGQLSRKDFCEPYALVVQDDKASQSITQCLNKEREALLDNEIIASVSEDERWQLRNNEYQFGNDGRVHCDVDRADNMVHQDGRVSPLHRLCLNKGKAAYLDNERNDGYMNYKSQQMKKDYDFRTDARIYPDVNRFDILVDRKDSKGERYCREVSLNDRKKAYLQSESQQLLKDRETKSYAMTHPDVSKSDILVDREYARSLRYRGVPLNDREEAYLQRESQQLLNGHETNSYVMMHPDVSKSDILVDQEYARSLRYRGVPLNDREEAYLQRERQQLLNGHETNSYVMMHPDVSKSDILVDREYARSLRYRGVPLNDRDEAYLQRESQQLLNGHETDSYVMMHPDVSKSDILVDREYARGLRYRGMPLNDRDEAYLQRERQQLLHGHETDSYVMMNPDVNRSDTLVEQEDARGLRYRVVSPNDRRNEAYLQRESQKLLNGYETNSYVMMHPDVNKSDILVGWEDAIALKLRRSSFGDGKESCLDKNRGDTYLAYESQQLKKDYDYGTDERIYRDDNRSDIVDYGDAKALELERGVFSDRSGAYLDNETRDVYQHYRVQQRKDIDERMYPVTDERMYPVTDERMYHPSVTRSEILVDQGGARALERRGASLNDGRGAYLNYESHELLRDHEIDLYGTRHPDVSRSSAGMKDEEALRSRRYVFDDRNQVNLNDELLQLRNGDHVKVHANTRYQDARHDEVYYSNDEMLLRREAYGRRDDASEVIYEEVMAYDYNYSDVKQLDEKADSKRFHKHEVAYDYRNKRGNYAMDGGTSSDQFRNLADERNTGNVDHTSTSSHRVSAKERLGGRVEDSHGHVKNEALLHRVRNPKLKGRYQKRNQKNIY